LFTGIKKQENLLIENLFWKQRKTRKEQIFDKYKVFLIRIYKYSINIAIQLNFLEVEYMYKY